MGRPHTGRWIGHRPNSLFFKPSGTPVRELSIRTIDLDELEAMRLVDAEGLSQTAAAESMKVSQSTIARLLASGRKKTAHALAHGQALRLQQGIAPLNYHDQPVAPAFGRRGGRHRHGRRNGQA